jgi:hypothetical protein
MRCIAAVSLRDVVDGAFSNFALAAEIAGR